MDHLHIRTSGGVFGFVGQLHGDRPRPALLAINGSFPQKEYLHDLVTVFPGANVLIAYLPGMGPPWIPTTLPQLAQGLGEAVRRLVGDVPLVVFSVSTGNLVGFGLDLPNITRTIAVEPFFRTADLTPFIAFARDMFRDHPEAGAEHLYLEALFGIYADGRLEERDYRHLVRQITVPTDVIVGTDLGPWKGEGEPWPSFTSNEDRALLESCPHVRLHAVGEGTGHGVAVSDPGKSYVYRLIHQALLEASKRFA